MTVYGGVAVVFGPTVSVSHCVGDQIRKSEPEADMFTDWPGSMVAEVGVTVICATTDKDVINTKRERKNSFLMVILFEFERKNRKKCFSESKKKE